ncbi:MAG: acyl carrier protein [Undibacterium sp.]|nr:acyl carrier protein [Opitutaceae bacterium]
MSSTPAPLDPPQLARFPADVRAAYRCYRATGDAAAVQVVVLSAVREHCPRQPTLGSDDSAATINLHLVDDLGYDSLAIAELVFFLEDLFEVSICTQEIQAIGTVGELRGFVAQKLAEKSAAA